MRALLTFILTFAFLLPAAAVSKPHVVSLGKATPVKLLVGPSESKSVDITIRPLYVDTRLKSYTTGDSHDVTDRQFVVRAAYRINDSLPEEARKVPKWLWQRGGWLLVDRVSGRISLIKLPDFDPFYSDVSWYRDYAAYCGITSTKERADTVVAELGNKKPLFHKELGKAVLADSVDDNCFAPHWERQPARVTFQPRDGDKFTVTVNGRFADEMPVDEAEEP